METRFKWPTGQVCLLLILGTHVLLQTLVIYLLTTFYMYLRSTGTFSLFTSLTDNNVFVEFHHGYFLVKDQDTKTILFRGRGDDGLYSLANRKPSQVLLSTKITQELWHQRLGHPSISVVHRILQSNNIAVASNNSGLVCDACQQAKVHQLPFTSSLHVSSTPLELVFTDVWGTSSQICWGFQILC